MEKESSLLFFKNDMKQQLHHCHHLVSAPCPPETGTSWVMRCLFPVQTGGARQCCMKQTCMWKPQPQCFQASKGIICQNGMPSFKSDNLQSYRVETRTSQPEPSCVHRVVQASWVVPAAFGLKLQPVSTRKGQSRSSIITNSTFLSNNWGLYCISFTGSYTPPSSILMFLTWRWSLKK